MTHTTLNSKALEAAEAAWRSSVSPTCKAMIGEAICAYLAVSAPVVDAQVQQLIDWLNKRSGPDQGIDYENTERRHECRVFGEDARFTVDNLHGKGAKKLAAALQTALSPETTEGPNYNSEPQVIGNTPETIMPEQTSAENSPVSDTAENIGGHSPALKEGLEKVVANLKSRHPRMRGPFKHPLNTEQGSENMGGCEPVGYRYRILGDNGGALTRWHLAEDRAAASFAASGKPYEIQPLYSSSTLTALLEKIDALCGPPHEVIPVTMEGVDSLARRLRDIRILARSATLKEIEG